MGDKILIATESFASQVKIDGRVQDFHVLKGQTRIREGHPLVKANPQYFAPIEDRIHYDVEQTTARPGERRGG